MAALADLESERQQIQAALDGVCSPAERNARGQFATPPALARQIAKEAARRLGSDSVAFLEPAIGTGAFYAAVLNQLGPERISRAVGFEIDPTHVNHAIALWNDQGLTVYDADFTAAQPPVSDRNRFDLIISNPPYVRHHHLSRETKARLRNASQAAAGVRLSGLAGLYCHFMLLSHAWMRPGALGLWLVPSEFLDVNYGEQIKRYLLDSVALQRIHRYDSEDMQFADALVSSAVVVFSNRVPSNDDQVEMSLGGPLESPRDARMVDRDELRRSRKWTSVPVQQRTAAQGPRLTLGDVFSIKRGIVTGDNSFFVVDAETARERGLPPEFLTPILPSPRELDGDEVQADEDGLPLLAEPRFLIHCDLPPEQVRRQVPRLWDYLREGEPTVSSRYLCRHRTPWYRQESRPPAPLLCTYMGRSSADGRGPFRFVLNHSCATAPNVYLAMYPRPAVQEAIARDPELLRVIWRRLNDIDPQTMIASGRVYGGGLHKIEPRELASVPLDDFPIEVGGDGGRGATPFGDRDR